jgi:O-antigen/teichoic acid export membrane protein
VDLIPASTRLRRRSGAAIGIYASAGLGIAGSLVVFRVLGPTDAGRFSIVIGAVSFFSLLVDLTSDEALVKYGFRYAAQDDWGRFHQVVRLTFSFEFAAALLAAALVAGLAPFAGSIFNGGGGLLTPMLIGALLPPLQAIESMGAAALTLRSRYDIRGAFLTVSMALRLVGLAIGTHFGVTQAVLGVLVAQLITTASIAGVGVAALRHFPAAPRLPLGDDRTPILKFVFQSSLDTGLTSLRAWVAPLTLGIVQNAAAVGLFRGAQAPESGFATFSAPARMVLLTDQTRDWELGRFAAVIADLRRYVVVSTLLMVVILPPTEWAMPWLVRTVLSDKYAGAADAARLILGSAALQLIFGWTKSFPVTIGRPGLRVFAHAVETAVLLPLIIVFGYLWGVSGAGGAVLASSAAYGLVWIAIVIRLRGSDLKPAFEQHAEA